MSEYRRKANLFWPVLLIGVGILILLSNLGYIENLNFFSLFRWWPLLLIALGIQVLFGRERPWVGSLISVALVAAAIAVLVFAPSLGFQPPSDELVTERFSVPIENATTAAINIETDRGSITASPVGDSDTLIQSVVTHSKETDVLTFDVTGTSSKTISLDLEHDARSFDFDWLFSGLLERANVNIDVSLTPNVPLSLDVKTGSGNADLDLSGLDIQQLDADTGSGSITVTLPTGDYPVDLGAGSGSLTIELEANVVLDLDGDVGSGRIYLTLADGVSGVVKLSSGSGTIKVVVPEGVGVQVSGSTGSGSVRLPGDYIRISGEDVPGPSDSGTWQSPNFDDAEMKVYIKFSVGSGSFRLEED